MGSPLIFHLQLPHHSHSVKVMEASGGTLGECQRHQSPGEEDKELPGLFKAMLVQLGKLLPPIRTPREPGGYPNRPLEEEVADGQPVSPKGPDGA